MKDKFLNIFGKFKVFSTLSVLLFTFFTIEPVKADFNNLVPCKESPAFQKRLTSSVKKLENRLKLYTPESKEAGFLNSEINATKQRFERYSNANLLCGKEGLPRIIATGQWDRANEFVIPGILFIYITGWIGWVGRKYLRYASTTENSFENEIIINVPIALTIMNSGFLWPVDAWKEFTSGDLLVSEDDVTKSPR
jgi:photosystem I subunit 3